jgi:hypothetical protein
MRFTVSLEDVQSLLASRDLTDAQQEVAVALKANILPLRFATPYQRSLLMAEVSVEEIKRLLSEERGLLYRFALMHLSVPDDPALIDGEFPEGEEPDPDDRSVVVGVLGYESGFLITQAIYVVLARRGREKLLSYLKSQRIPRAASACKELIGYLEKCSSRT